MVSYDTLILEDSMFFKGYKKKANGRRSTISV
jgi:hypothetical protein